MALSLFRAPVLPLALMGGVAALVWSQRRKDAAGVGAATGQGLRYDPPPLVDIRLGWQGVDLSRPPAPPAPPPGPREPRPGDPCIGDFDLGCPVTSSDVIDPYRQTRVKGGRLGDRARVPKGGLVDILAGPVMVRITADGDDLIYTPATFYQRLDPDFPNTPGVETFYKVRYCRPVPGAAGFSTCIEGWTERRNLVPPQAA